MKRIPGCTLFASLLVAAGALAQNAPAPAPSPSDSLEPGVNTSAPAPQQEPQPAVPTPAPAPAARTSAARPNKPAAPNAAATAPRKSTAKDRLDLESTEITGNRELPKVLYIVPWRSAELGDLVGRPVNSLLDEVLEPADREVFRRTNRYFEALQPNERGAAGNSGNTSPPPSKP
jgi:hypothetical protein